MLQELLTYVIELIAVGGFGGILAHHITQNCISVPVPQSISQTASVPVAPTLTCKLEPTPAIVKPQEKPQPEAEQPSVADPWELPILTSCRRWETHQPRKPVLALCPAVDSAPVPVSTEDQTASKSRENDTTSFS